MHHRLPLHHLLVGDVTRFLYAVALSGVVLAACGSSDSSVPDSSVCGTHSEAGVLTLINIVPAKGASVPNRNIIHSFTVVNAPGDFHDYLDLIYGDGHTAGVSTPPDPTFQATISGSDVKYQMLIDGWNNAPGHVVLVARGGYDTSKGCTWVFPSPLFEYDITAVGTPDGGATPDSKPAVDGLGWIIGPVDTAGARAAEVGAPEVAPSVEVSPEAARPLDVSTEIDGGAALDANVDGGI